MTIERPVIAVCPDVLLGFRPPGVPHPVTPQHTRTACSDCGRMSWIGPRQKERAALGDLPVVCYLCLLTAEEAGAMLKFLDAPDADG